MRIFHVGILGCGVISRTYISDIQSFYPSLHIDACADIDKEAAKKTAAEYGIEKIYTPDELLRDSEIDIVINLTPPQCHVELNKQIICAGKHLFSEKPFATSVDAAGEVIKLAEEKNVKIGCAPDTFLSSGLQSVKFYLDAGLIGKPFMVTANMTTFGVETWHPKPEAFYKKDAGPLFDMGPYYVSAIVSLLGSVASVSAYSARPYEKRHVYTGPLMGEDIPCEADTTYVAILMLKCGIVVNLSISYDIYRSNLPMFEIYGDEGTLTYPDPNFGGGTPRVYRKEQYTDPIFRKSDEALEKQNRFYELPELFPNPKNYSRGIGVLDLAAAIETGSANRANGELIEHVTEVLERIKESAEQKCEKKLITSCSRPDGLKPGGYLGRI